MSIRNKIIFSYILLILLSFAILGSFFKVTIKDFLVKNAQENLKRQGLAIQKLYNGSLKTPESLQNIRNKPLFRFGGKLVDGDIIVVDLNGNILYSSRKDILGTGGKLEYAILDKIQTEGTYKSIKIGDADVVASVFPIRSKENNKTIGAVVMYTMVKGIKILSARIFGVLLKGFVLAGVISVFIGFILSRSITAPINKLTEMAGKLSKRKFGEKVDLKADGEIKVLTDTFNQMTEELNDYYIYQKKFLQNASHELKTPLMSIQGYAEGIKDGVIEGEDVNKSLDIIIDESKRLRDIVNDLMLLSKIETHQENMVLNIENLRGILDDVIQRLAPQIDNRKLNVFIQCDNDIKLKCDRKKLIQAFVNILGNAVRYAKSQIKIHTSLKNNIYELIFENDGRQFTEEEAKNMFERFYKGEKGETGLGLAITKAIIESHEGRIYAENTIEGVKFVIELKRDV